MYRIPVVVVYVSCTSILACEYHVLGDKKYRHRYSRIQNPVPNRTDGRGVMETTMETQRSLILVINLLARL